MRSTMRLEMARPRPVPPNLRVGGAVRLLEIVEDARLSSGTMPMPVSRTGSGSVRPLRGSTWTHAAAFGELDGVADQVEQDLAQARGIADDAMPATIVDDRTRARAPLACARGASSSTASRPGGEPERPRLEIELAGLDLGEVENVLDQRQQRIAGGHRPVT